MMAKRRMEQNMRTISFIVMIFNIIIASGSDCDKELTGIKGRFSSPNHPYHYPANTKCAWIIKSPENIKNPEIILKFRAFEIEPQAVCNYDYVEVGYGNIPGENILGKYCGEMKPRPIKSSSRVMWLRFVSDKEKSYKGFLAFWKVKEVSHTKPFPNPRSNENECGESNLFGDKGTIKSPRYPNNYPYHLQCRWVIKAPEQNQIVIRFEYFDLEGASKCRFDYVAVRDGEKEDSSVIGSYCGSSKPATITTSSNVTSISFNSDTSISAGGFVIRWNTKPTTKAPVVCGGQLTSKQGRLKSPSYPNFYPEDTKCAWIISVQKHSRIQLTFNEFDLESEENCGYDFVRIRDGANAGGREIGKYCGQINPGSILSNTSSLYIIFETDKSVPGKGFSADWMAVDHRVTVGPSQSLITPTTPQKCGGHFTDSTGVIISPGYPSLYPSNQHCVWVLNMSRGNQIRLNFEYFDLEENLNCVYDYLVVRDGAEVTSPIFGKFCGPSTYISEDTLYSSGKGLRIEFHSDKSTSKGGFRLSWKGSTTIRPPVQGPTTTRPPVPGPSNMATKHKIMKNCGGVFELGIFSGTIFSPGYPEPYKRDLKCTWTIEVSNSNQVAVSFNDFNLEESSKCISDYVIVRDGISKNSDILGKYCGSKVPVFLMSTKNELSLTFHTNERNNGKGFEISWMSYKPYVNIIPTLDDKKAKCVKQSSTLSGKASSSAASDECQWRLHAAVGNRIQLDFTTFDFSDTSCVEDYIEILNGLTEHAPIMAKFCSTSRPYRVISTGRHLTLRYITSGQMHTNFELNYIEVGHQKFDQNWFINGVGCGLSSSKENINLKKERRENVLGEWPWQVALTKKHMTSLVTCGGFLIARQWVISAAHCFKRSTSGNRWLVKLGLVNIHSSGNHAQTFKVNMVYIHPSYNSTTNENDIALIKLHKPAKLNEYVNAICLPEEDSKELYEPGNTCHVAGWNINNPLSSMALPLVQKSQCNNFENFVVTNTMLCAGYTDIDTCQGDGGGALMCQSNQRFIAVGINSVGQGCGDRQHVGVYTDVRPFLNWIKMKLLE